MKIEFYRKILEKYSNIKFQAHPSNRSRAALWGKTYRHDETSSRFSQFCKGA